MNKGSQTMSMTATKTMKMMERVFIFGLNSYKFSFAKGKKRPDG